MTLREIFEAFWTITEVDVTARDANGRFIHKWIYGPNIHVSMFQRHEVEDGKLTIVDGKINAHGDPARGGTETGWGVKEKLFPADMLDAPIRFMSVGCHHNGEHTLRVDVTMHPMTVMALVPERKEHGDTFD